MHEILQVLNGHCACLMNLEFRIIHKKGHFVWLSLEVLPVQHSDNTTGFEGFCRDITERKKLDELKDNLIRDVSHELKTPVASIEMAIDMFERSLLGRREYVYEKISQIHNILQNNVYRLKNTIRNVLDISRLDSGVEPLKLTDFSFIDLTNQVIEELKDAARHKKNTVFNHIPATIPLIRADRDKMHQVMTNLINNALKFTENGKISISSILSSDTLEVTVEDTGKGLDKDVQKRVFEKFYKENPSSHGSGIGLAICENIIQLHNGKIWVKSEGKGKGSQFTFSLPIISPNKSGI
jgi:signal transduction histidine kinase